MACMEGIAFVEYMSYELLENGALVGKNIFATGGAVSSNLATNSCGSFTKIFPYPCSS